MELWVKFLIETLEWPSCQEIEEHKERLKNEQG